MRVVMTLTTTALVACGGGHADCDTGFSDIDGICYEDAPETGPGGPIDAYLDALPDCVPGDPGASEMIDGCLRGECIGVGTWGTLSADLSMTVADCDVYSTLSFCEIDGYDLRFSDEDNSGTLTDADTLDGFTVTTEAERDGDGHGVGVSLACYVDVLGSPRTLDFVGADESLIGATWSVLNLWVEDGLVTGVNYRP